MTTLDTKLSFFQKAINPELYEKAKKLGLDFRISINSAFVNACSLKDFVLIKFLFDEIKLDINHVYEDKNALMLACFTNCKTHHDIEIINYLLDKGINVDTQDELKRTSLFLLSLFDDYTNMKKILLKGANPNLKSKQNPYYPLLRVCTYGCAKLLLDYGANINVKDADNLTLLLKAQERYDLELVSLCHDMVDAKKAENCFEEPDSDEEPQIKTEPQKEKSKSIPIYGLQKTSPKKNNESPETITYINVDSKGKEYPDFEEDIMECVCKIVKGETYPKSYNKKVTNYQRLLVRNMTTKRWEHISHRFVIPIIIKIAYGCLYHVLKGIEIKEFPNQDEFYVRFDETIVGDDYYIY